MTKLTRRESLRLLLAGLGSLAGGTLLGGCSPQETPARVANTRPAAATATRRPAATSGPTADSTAESSAVPETAELATASPQPTAGEAGYPDLVVARGGEPETLVRRALGAIGGIERFVHPGNDVIVKPNICVAYHTYEYAATTNPWIVAALVKMCLEAGARRVRVMDQPFGGTPEEAYARSGIQDQVLAAGGEMEIMSRLKFAPTEIPDGHDIQEWEIYEDALTADVVIDVPIAKTHGLARLTLGMKNLMGLVNNRPGIHRNIGQRLADLASRIRPALTVVDAVRILTANGPTGGNLADVKQLDTVIVSPDIVAADSYAATLFGLRPEDLAFVTAGAAMGLGRSDLGSLRIEELAAGG